MSSLYLHVSNSGITFEVTEEYGPTVKINTASFGNINHELKFFTTQDGLREIGELFIKASKREFGKEYCHTAKPPSAFNWSSKGGEEPDEDMAGSLPPGVPPADPENDPFKVSQLNAKTANLKPIGFCSINEMVSEIGKRFKSAKKTEIKEEVLCDDIDEVPQEYVAKEPCPDCGSPKRDTSKLKTVKHTEKDIEEWMRRNSSISPKTSEQSEETVVVIEVFENALAGANEVCRSAYEIAQRAGKRTDWHGFKIQLSKQLEIQHGLMYPKPVSA